MASKLEIACASYDRVKPLEEGRARIEGYELAFHHIPAGDIPKACFDAGKYAVGEVSPANLSAQIDKGKNAYCGLPVFLSRAFRHGSIFVRKDGKVKKPADLKGGRIGMSDYFGTTAMWQRGVLQDDYGVDVSKVTWVVGPNEAGGAFKPAPTGLDGKLTFETVKEGDDLSSMMARGELDAILALRTPKAFAQGRMARLFENYREVEEEYYRKTGIFPILHILILRNDEIARDPKFPAKVFAGFSEAKKLALADVEEIAFYFTSLPWLSASVERAKKVMGPDLWPYGLEEGRKAAETFLRYCQEQGLTSRRLTVEEFFPHG